MRTPPKPKIIVYEASDLSEFESFEVIDGLSELLEPGEVTDEDIKLARRLKRLAADRGRSSDLPGDR